MSAALYMTSINILISILTYLPLSFLPLLFSILCPSTYITPYLPPSLCPSMWKWWSVSPSLNACTVEMTYDSTLRQAAQEHMNKRLWHSRVTPPVLLSLFHFPFLTEISSQHSLLWVFTWMNIHLENSQLALLWLKLGRNFHLKTRKNTLLVTQWGICFISDL